MEMFAIHFAISLTGSTHSTTKPAFQSALRGRNTTFGLDIARAFAPLTKSSWRASANEFAWRLRSTKEVSASLFAKRDTSTRTTPATLFVCPLSSTTPRARAAFRALRTVWFAPDRISARHAHPTPQYWPRVQANHARSAQITARPAPSTVSARKNARPARTHTS